MLVEGMSMRSISCTVGVSINTVTKLMVEAGEACAAYHDEAVRNVTVNRVQCDEIWSFCYAKDKNVAKAKAAPQGAAVPIPFIGLSKFRRCQLRHLMSVHLSAPEARCLR
ncbi:MAG: hypothetical protein AAF367_19365 [Pseudomonadota bacterium]